MLTRTYLLLIGTDNTFLLSLLILRFINYLMDNSSFARLSLYFNRIVFVYVRYVMLSWTQRLRNTGEESVCKYLIYQDRGNVHKLNVLNGEEKLLMDC